MQRAPAQHVTLIEAEIVCQHCTPRAKLSLALASDMPELGTSRPSLLACTCMDPLHVQGVPLH